MVMVMRNRRERQENETIRPLGPCVEPGLQKRMRRRSSSSALAARLLLTCLVSSAGLRRGGDSILLASSILAAPTTAVAAFEVSRQQAPLGRSDRTPDRPRHLLQYPWVVQGNGGVATLQLQSSRDRYTQVISDVDDTLKSSGGVNIGGVALGGIDTQYARGDVYPGVAEFYLHLSLNPSTGIAPKVAVLTARAEEFKSLLELKESSKVAQALAQAGSAANVSDWGLGPVLYGSVAEWIAQDRKGLRKFSNFERLLSQDPTGEIMRYCYVGDTGELDQEAGETMLREYPEVVQAVFLHVVSDKPYPRIPPFKIINGRPVVFFRTYVGAAVAAVQLELMTPDGLQAVVDAACDKLASVPQSSDKWIDLRRDLERANRILKVV